MTNAIPTYAALNNSTRPANNKGAELFKAFKAIPVEEINAKLGQLSTAEIDSLITFLNSSLARFGNIAGQSDLNAGSDRSAMMQIRKEALEFVQSNSASKYFKK
jgi:hypothetical protein